MSAASDLPVTIYTPESPLRNPVKMVREMFRDLLASRELAWRLFVRDTSAQYRQSMFGYVWAFLPPIVTTATWTYLSRSNILHIGETPIPYPAFVLAGTLLWGAFMESLNVPLKAFNSGRSLLSRINFPREALLLGALADALFNLCVRLLILIPVFLWYKVPVGPSLLLFPLGIAALMTLGMGLGLLINPLAILYSDVGRALGMVSTFWMLLTPVVYPPPTHGLGGLLAKWNPVSPLLLAAREWLTSSPATHPNGFLIVTCVSVVAFGAGWFLFRITMPIVIERSGA
jgi:lipopolysaccharide transport system permease protein